jgi:hypothetical protein
VSQSHIPSRGVDDGLRWNLKKNGISDIRSFYTALRVLPNVDFPWKSIWRIKTPCKACFFVWTTAWNRILMCDNLHNRGYTLPSWCCMCCSNGETVDHLLLHCLVAVVLWSWIFQAFGVQWVLFGIVADLLFSWWNGLSRHSSDIWNMVPICLMWTIWKERNQRTFEDVSRLDSQLLEGFIQTLFDWSRVWGFTTSASISVFMSSLLLSLNDVYL